MRILGPLAVLFPIVLFTICCSGIESPSVHWKNTGQGFTVEYRDKAGLLVKRIEMSRDSIPHGCYIIFSKDGQPKLHAYFSDGLLDGGWYAVDDSCHSGGEIRGGAKEGLWEYHQSENGHCILRAAFSFRNGVRYGGQFWLDSTNGSWVYSISNGNREVGSAALKGETEYDLRGEFYFFDLGRSPAEENEVEPMLYVADVPGLNPVISVLIQDDDDTSLLHEIEPLRYENRMFVWSVVQLKEAGTDEAGLVDFKFLDRNNFHVHRDLVYLLPFSYGMEEN